MLAWHTRSFRGGAGWIRPAFSVCLFAIAGLLAVCPPAMAAKQLIGENKGQICFRATSDGLEGTFRPFLGCLSSSCTRVLERTVTARVDAATGTIALTSRFVVEHTGASVCTMDCGGGGQGILMLRGLEPRRYRVTLGEYEIGVLDAGAQIKPGERVCLSTPEETRWHRRKPKTE